jgi:hypothetical protein
MAVVAFPALKPSSRSWTPGSWPVQAFNTLSGYETRISLGSKPIGGSLSLKFSNLKEADLLKITDHYNSAQGVTRTFSLSTDVFAGMTNSGKVTPSGFSWRYAAPPSIDWVAPGIGNISVALVAVPN